MWRHASRLAAFFLLGAGVHAQAPTPPLSTVIDRLHSYLREYAVKLPATIATENYEQRCGPPDMVPGRQRVVLVSEFGMMRMESPAGWLGLRDVQSVNGKALEDQGHRLQDLFGNPSAREIAQAKRIAMENARFNVGPIQRTINDPAVVLALLDDSDGSRVRFSKAGDTTMDRTSPWILKFDERRRPTLVQSPTGRDQPSKGRIWVDPATGRLMRAELTIDSPTERIGPVAHQSFTATIGVDFAEEPNLGFWVPAKMTERLGSTTCSGDATYTNYRTFSVQTRILP
jgi:hypothetical protein